MTGRRQRACGTKIRHKSRGDALSHMYVLTRTTGASKALLNVYRCEACGCWHVGHRKVRKR